MIKREASGRTVQDISAERLAQLNAGAQAATLTECLAIDFAELMGNVMPDIGDDALTQMRQAKSAGISRRMPLAANLISKRFGATALKQLERHPSDTARGWACFMIGDTPMSLAKRLTAIRPFANDPHFGVREWAWMAVRPHLSAELPDAISKLAANWARHRSERIRRFASESIRPRGVWCAHISALKREPELASAVLEPLRSDPSGYVQDSVGNWLNDASKDRPDWVRTVCARWTAESPTPETARICRRAQRSLSSNVPR